MALQSRIGAENMGLIEYHLDVIAASSAIEGRENQEFTKGLIHEYQDIFQGIGKLKDVRVNLHVVPTPKESSKTKRNIRYLEGQVGETVKKMRRNGYYLTCSSR